MAVRFCLPSPLSAGYNRGMDERKSSAFTWLVIASTVYVLTVGVAVAMLIFGPFQWGIVF
jgi:hypothetical protein